ncbi:hypothetical protein MPTK2_3g15590 [Marchantia polymorpha subsp. ruderalis]
MSFTESVKIESPEVSCYTISNIKYRQIQAFFLNIVQVDLL